MVYLIARKGGQDEKVALISCTKSKRDHSCAAKKLYDHRSPWFKYAFQYAQSVADEVYILSATHGLVIPEQILDPYNETLKEMNRDQRVLWRKKVLEQLEEQSDLSKDEYIIIAGYDYYSEITPFMKHYEIPLKGKSMLLWVGEL